MRIIHPFVNYRDALELANLETAYNRRQARTILNFFRKLVQNQNISYTDSYRS